MKTSKGLIFFKYLIILLILRINIEAAAARVGYERDVEALGRPFTNEFPFDEGVRRIVIPPHRPMERDTVINVLSIDGGGVRGVIAARLLNEIEHRSRRRIADMFDLIAGTSTGGILALGLTAPHPTEVNESLYSAADMIKFYTDLGGKIFPPSPWYSGIASPFWTSRYHQAPLARTLNDLLGRQPFSLCRTPVLITGVNVRNNNIKLFRSHRARYERREEFFKSEVALATSAAPTYLPMAKIRAIGGGEELCFVDGGMAANNPSLLALSEAYGLFGHRRINFVSLGTGTDIAACDPDTVSSRNWLKWIKPSIDMLFDCNAHTVENTMRDLSAAAHLGLNYYRFQIPLEPTLLSFDNGARKNISALNARAGDMIAERTLEIDELITKLNSAKPPQAFEEEIMAGRLAAMELERNLVETQMIVRLIALGQTNEQIIRIFPTKTVADIEGLRH